MIRDAAAIALGALFSACMPPSTFAQRSSCIVESGITSNLLRNVRGLYAASDSVALVAAGHPYAAPTAVALETNSQVCDAAVSAYNRDFGTSVSQAVVFSLGTLGFVVVLPATDQGRHAYRIYRADWSLVETLEG